MKKNIFALLAIFMLAVTGAFAQTVTEETKENLDAVTGFPQIEKKPSVILDEGVSTTLITRLEKMEGRSNFVYQDELVGAYFALQTVNIQPADSLTRIAIYYPVYNSFNGMKQKSSQMFLYAVDLFWGPCFRADMWKYVKIDFAFGPHFMYQLTDEYHLLYLGGAAILGIGLPVAKRWTIVTDGTISVDYANFGSNKNIQPFNYEWQYQFSFGVRYSRKNENKYSYIHSRQK